MNGSFRLRECTAQKCPQPLHHVWKLFGSGNWCLLAPTSLFSSNQSTLLLAHFAFVSLLHCAADVVRKIFFFFKKGERVMSSSYYEGSKWEAHFPPQKMIFPYLCSLSAPLLLHCNLTPPTPSEGSMVAIISSKSSYLSVPALNVFEKRREEEREGGRKGGETLWGKWRLEWGQGMAFITYGKEKKEAVAKKLRESEEKTLRKQKEGKNERGTD